MIRFSADEAELEALLRFLMRRGVKLSNGQGAEGVLMAPLAAGSRDDLRFRRTPRPLLTRLREEDAALTWGLRPAFEQGEPLVTARTRTGQLQVDPEASRMIVLQLGPAQGPERRREGLLEARDWFDPADASPDTLATQSRREHFARELVERCARRIRRRGRLENGRWHIPA